MTRDDDSTSGSGDETNKPGSARLLLVDDSPTNRMLALSMLRKMGFEPVAVESGSAAVEAVKKGGFAAVLMDVWMPDMDGFEATAAIRALPGPEKDIPIIALTADTDRKDRQRCLDSGMNDFISKPVDRNFLAAMIGRLTGDTGGAFVDETVGSVSASDMLIDDDVLNGIRVATGPDIIEFVATYMLEVDGRMKRMAGAAAKGDLDTVVREVHDMKSTSGTYGALRLERVSKAVEEAAKSGDAGKTVELMSVLATLVQETWRAFGRRGMRPTISPEKTSRRTSSPRPRSPS